jgi:hypothetical protein
MKGFLFKNAHFVLTKEAFGVSCLLLELGKSLASRLLTVRMKASE